MMAAHAMMKALTILSTAMLMLTWPGTASAAQRDFPSTQDGFASLVTALKSNDLPSLKAMLGPEATDLLYSGDAVADANARKEFVAAYATRYAINALDEAHATLSVGKDDWEFPIPMSKVGGRWHFDTATGRQELLNRRIGRNETATIQASLAYVDAQRDFAARTHAVGAMPYYALRFVSSPGNRDGLYWPAAAGEPASPLGPLFANAQLRGYAIPESGVTPGPPRPYFGYVYKILQRRGRLRTAVASTTS